MKNLKELNWELDTLKMKHEGLEGSVVQLTKALETYVKLFGDRLYETRMILREQFCMQFPAPFKIGEKTEDGVVIKKKVFDVIKDNIIQYFLWQITVVNENEKKSDVFYWGNGNKVTVEEIEQRK